MTNSPLTAQQASHDVRVAIVRLRRRLREVANNRELTASQTSVLSRLHKQEADTAAGLATLEKVRQQSMAATLQALQKRSLIAREYDPKDGRRQRITLTPEGIDFFEGSLREREGWLTSAMERSCTAAECETLIAAAALMERLADA